VASQKDINNQKQLNSEYAVTRDILKEIQDSLGKQRDATKEATSEYRKLESIAQKLLLDEEQIVQLTDRQIQQNRDKAASSLEQIKVQAKRLMAEKGITDIKSQQLDEIENITEAQKELLSAAKDGYNVETTLVNQIEAELKVREKSNKLLGVSGNILKGINAIAGNFSKAFGLDEVQKKMQETADEAVRMNKAFGGLRVAAAGFGEAFNQLGNTLLSPTVLLTNMVIGFNKVDKAATDFQRQTGQDLNTMSTSLDQFNGGLITTVDLMGAASNLTQEFGLNAASVFTSEDLSEAASMTKEMGLAGKEAANLARLSKINGGNIESQNESIVAGINSANKQNRTAVAHGQALRDVANASEGIAISYAGFPEKLGAAATAARGLGMSLADVDRIAGSLLDFQSSIEAEMEAELLTGRSLNLEKARQLALDNDLAGVATELANQGITSANFSKMNRIQQEAQAKALGMSRDEMARMLLQQQIGTDLSGEGLSAAQKTTLEDLKRVEAQEKFATAIAKLQQALAPIVSMFADLASNSTVIYGTMGVALLSKMPSLLGSVKSLASGFSGILKTTSTIGESVSKVGGATGSLGGGKALNSTLSGLGKGLSSLGKSLMGPQLAGLAAGLALLTASMIGIGFALKLAAPGFEAIGTIITSAFAGIATIITSVAEGFVTMFGALNSENIGALLLIGPALLGISAGLTSMAVTGLMALPVIGALTALGTVSEGLGSVFNNDAEPGGGGGANGSMKAVEAKLDELIAVISAGGDVYIDGAKVGKTVALATSNLG
tara:strand:- start:5898 stop:8246 length:2349 start_codon:yes stop_codon:yes gene_type:complete